MLDDRSPSDATVKTTFNILVIDINDNAPQFNSSEYTVSIPELAQLGFALPLYIQVQDKDEVRAKTCISFLKIFFMNVESCRLKISCSLTLGLKIALRLLSCLHSPLFKCFIRPCFTDRAANPPSAVEDWTWFGHPV